MRCLDALATFACRHLREFSPQNISNTTWAMATLQYKNMVCPLLPHPNGMYSSSGIEHGEKHTEHTS